MTLIVFLSHKKVLISLKIKIFDFDFGYIKKMIIFVELNGSCQKPTNQTTVKSSKNLK